ncbi:response regulator transcription factor [Streptomyces sp. DSM 44917]|uniref:Response regulator transcription factor n=1 Tax=Streptomyces boetiae TaxID=3075541 RepID=A0ABU2LEY7_9ACTN|nr:response regulator transcription factor [Streptomyces sp. DSM 44917]MDT0309743.1 response regulator transcription factor [Streptomyces sp. DSM 44917]
MSGPVRVLVVDDQRVVRAGFAAVLGAEPGLTVAGQAGDGAEALRLAADPGTRPDVALMDLRMPGMDGIEATRLLTRLDPPVRVLVLTTFRRDEYVFAALRAGASGFLLKDCDPRELVDAIRAVAAGEALLAPAVTRRLVDAFRSGAVAARPRPAGDARLAALTPRETEVLRQVARGLANAEIARALGISRSTVKTHLNAVLAKLRLRDRAQAIVLAYETGLAGTAPEDDTAPDACP